MDGLNTFESIRTMRHKDTTTQEASLLFLVPSCLSGNDGCEIKKLRK